MIPAASPLVRSLEPFSPADGVFGSTVSYGFTGSGVSIDTREFTGGISRTLNWTAVQKDIVRDTLEYISTVVDLDFVERSFGNVTIEFSQIPTLGPLTTGFAESQGFGESQIVVPTDFIFPVAYSLDNVTIIHEIGHALGLSHPFDGPYNLPGVADPYDFGTFDVNSELATRMAYLPGYTATYPDLDIYGEAYSFGAVDIAALQLMYGANTSTGLGNTTYTHRPSELITIWDNGGLDTIDYGSATSKVYIDLRAATLENEPDGGGHLSFIDGSDGLVADGGFTIAFGVEIENARGGSGDDALGGNAVANAIRGAQGNDRIDGREGIDTALYSGDQSAYTLTLGAQDMTLADRRADGDGTDTLINIEALRFGGQADAFDLASFGGASSLSQAQMDSFIELYIAYFNRAPDAVGLNFWGTAFANGTTFEQMAALFNDQDETRETYAAGLSNEDFTTAVYGNVLGRDADADGFAFWVRVLDSGDRTRDQLILSVLEGAKTPISGGSNDARAQQIADQQYLANKSDIGAYYSVIKGLSDVDDARAAMALYTGSASSITSAQNAIDGFYASALDATDGAFILQLVGVIDDPFGTGIV